MCNRRCLHSSMIGMLCAAFWVPSRAITQFDITHHDLGLELVGSIGNFQIIAQLLVVDHVLNPILSSILVSKRSLVEGEVTCKHSRI